MQRNPEYYDVSSHILFLYQARRGEDIEMGKPTTIQTIPKRENIPWRFWDLGDPRKLPLPIYEQWQAAVFNLNCIILFMITGPLAFKKKSVMRSIKHSLRLISFHN